MTPPIVVHLVLEGPGKPWLLEARVAGCAMAKGGRDRDRFRYRLILNKEAAAAYSQDPTQGPSKTHPQSKKLLRANLRALKSSWRLLGAIKALLWGSLVQGPYWEPMLTCEMVICIHNKPIYIYIVYMYIYMSLMVKTAIISPQWSASEHR